MRRMGCGTAAVPRAVRMGENNDATAIVFGAGRELQAGRGQPEPAEGLRV
jgi:hypothetical protein